MVTDQEVDGSTTACVLLKYRGIRGSLIKYIADLCQRRAFEIIKKTEELDYNEHQSCDTTQIGYFFVDLCWYILEQDLPNLLREYILRSQYVENQKSAKRIFLSYCEENSMVKNRVRRIVDRLSQEGFEVFYYEDAPIGTNNTQYVFNVDVVDAVLLIGTKNYKMAAVNNQKGGVMFSDLADRLTLTQNMRKVIPIALDSYSESIPSPFDSKKGITCRVVNNRFLDSLVTEINKI
jgi:hypothetical protein